jgi:formylglycine-generating enzyme required for sulfatase activity
VAPDTGRERPITELLPPPKLVPSPPIDMVSVPAGEFWMGAADGERDARSDEQPRHRVNITQGFSLGKFKVTQAQFQEVMGNNPSSFGPEGQFKNKVKDVDTRQHPVESITWLEAVSFCNRLSERHGLTPYYRIDGAKVTVRGGTGFRLPTEAEWEYAARGKTQTRWHFGDDAAELGEFAWFADNSDGTTHPVGQKRPNAFGLCDMHGNVREWCWDRYGADYYRDSPTSDPPGPGIGTNRVARGGAWNDTARRTRAAARETRGIDYGLTAPIGLRVARSAE